MTPDDAAALPRGKRRSVAAYLVHFGFYDEARELLKRIVEENPDRIQYRSWLTQATLGCGKIEVADELSQKLLQDFPDTHWAISTRCAVLTSLGEAREAYDIMRRTHSDPRDSYSYWGHLAAGLQRRGWWTDAGAALGHALTLYQAKLKEREAQDTEEKYPPTYLWLALARQEEHEGVTGGPGATELERLRAEEENKVREVLAAPDRKEAREERRALRAARRESLEQWEEPDAALPEIPGLEECEPNSELEQHLRRFFGFPGFRPGQQQVVESVLKGGSVLAVMPTGGGKSLCYQLPAMLLDGITLVISPLIALMKDQVDGLPSAVQQQATLINSSLEGDEIERRLRDILAGRYKLVYAAPERLRQRPFLHALRQRGVSLLVVDEAHCVSMWGHDFRPDYLFIGDALTYLGDPAVLGMTATATPRMRVEICNHFGRQLHLVNTGTHRPNLFLESVVVRSDEDKLREVVRLCREIDGPGIIYTRSRRKAEELAQLLRRERVRAAYYHAGMDPDERSAAQEQFMDGRWRVICATVAFGMGIDKPDVRFVIHYSLPQSLEDYYQEAGRAGRDGFPSRCILLSTPSDKALATRWMRAERVGLDLPKNCYQMIRELTGESTFAAVHCDDFERDLQSDETQVRVAINMLEDVGLVRRHLDVPMTATVAVTDRGARQPADGFADFVTRARLRPNQRVPLETLELCERTGMAPHEIEEKLLEWRSQGLLAYHGSGRVMLLERLPAPKEARHELERLLARHAAAQEDRVEEIFNYAESNRCKHGLIARHFGEPPIERCGSCDSCTPQRQPVARAADTPTPAKRMTDDERTLRILETVQMLPAQIGFTGLVRVLKGSIQSGIKRDRCRNFGILAADPKTTIERRVGELLELGYLIRDDSEYRLISLGPAGEEMLRSR